MTRARPAGPERHKGRNKGRKQASIQDQAERKIERLGPRPLPLHLATQLATLISSRAALESLKNGSLAWNPRLRQAAEQIRAALGQADAEAFDRALAVEATRRVGDFLKGVDTYRQHPYRRRLAPPPLIWSQGTTRLYDYSLAGAKGVPLLAVPSLVNRAYILDLTRSRSLMRSLARKGFRPFLLDWDAPGAEEMRFGLDDYITVRLAGAVDVVTKRAGPPAVLGYCMGGLLALGLAALRPADIRGLVLLATPWDFHQPDDSQGRMITALARPIEDALALHGGLPVDLLQACFAAIDPGGIERKFRALAETGASGPRARDFVALEDWLNDGVMLAGPVARESLFGWYGENRPAQGKWRVAGKVVRPGRYKGPTLILLPQRDRIVPPASARALVAAMPQAQAFEVDSGHIGMVAGAGAATQVYGPLARWLSLLDSEAPTRIAGNAAMRRSRS